MNLDVNIEDTELDQLKDDQGVFWFEDLLYGVFQSLMMTTAGRLGYSNGKQKDG